MASRDSRNPFFPSGNSRFHLNANTGEFSSFFNWISWSQSSQINVAPSPSWVANGVIYPDPRFTWPAQQQVQDSIRTNQSLTSGLYGPHNNLNVIGYSMGVQGAGPFNHLAQVNHLHQLNLFGGFTVNGSLNNNHGMLYHNLHLHDPEQITRWGMQEPGPLNQVVQLNHHQRLNFFGGFSASGTLNNNHGMMLYNNLLLHDPEQHVPRGLGHFGDERFDFYGHHQPLIHGQGQQMNLESFLGRVVALAQDQVYSCVLQNMLDSGLSVPQIDMILQELWGCLNDLMKDQVGCKFVVMLFLACNEHQRISVLRDIAKYQVKLIQTCVNLNGSKSMQRFLENLNLHDQIRLMTSVLSDVAVPLSKDTNGCRVIQYCVRNFSSEDNELIFIKIASRCHEVATNKSGCIVIKDCIERSTGPPKELLFASITAKAVDLAEDPYGNYVVQQLIGLNIPWTLASLLERFKGHCVSFSCNKHASHVVEKLLSSVKGSDASVIIEELITSKEFRMLLSDQYANYVVQSALSVSKEKSLPEFQKLREQIETNKDCMETNIYGNKILSWFKKR